MVFAAGLGTRLRPLTLQRPKALMTIEGITLLEITLARLQHHGCTGAIVNVHHLGDQIIDFIETRDWGGMELVISDERSLLMDTGGGLKKAAWYLKDAPFLICNADILTNLNLSDLYRTHVASGALASLAVRSRSSSRAFLFDERNTLCGWRNTKTGETRMSRQLEPTQTLSFSGVHAASPALFDYMPENKSVFSIIEVYLQAAATQQIQAYPHDQDLWIDIGSPETLAEAQAIGLKPWMDA